MDSVSRETSAGEAEPEVAAELFGSAIGAARSYAAELIRRGEELGLIGPQELDRIWSRHLVNCVLLAPLLRQGRVGDVGSGAGLPGLVLAIARPDVQLVTATPDEGFALANLSAEWVALENGSATYAVTLIDPGPCDAVVEPPVVEPPTGEPTVNPPSLPETGAAADLGVLAGLGAMLVVLGGALLLRRRAQG